LEINGIMRAAFVHNRVNVTVLASCVESGGAEIALLHLLLGLNRDRFQPNLVCLRPEPGFIAKELHSKGIPVVFGVSRRKFDPLTGRRLVQILGKQVDILYFLHHHNVLFWAPYLMRHVMVKSSVLICHATRNSNSGPYFWLTDRPALRHMKRIITVAHGQKRYLVEAAGLPAERIEVIHNGVSPVNFDNLRSQVDDRNRIRQEWGLTEEHRVVMIIAFLRPEKNHTRFLRVARIVAERTPQARFIVVGDGPERSKLETYAQSLGLAKVVRFLGTCHDVPRLLAASDVITLTSDEETLPLALLEGMAARRPVVATRVGSLDEMVMEGETGHLIPIDDEPAFADALQRLLSDRVTAEAMGSAGRRFVLQHFTLKNMVQAHENLFQQLLRESSGRVYRIGE
jgi:glycosyltransferase involved in cell wall biosynthesis